MPITTPAQLRRLLRHLANDLDATVWTHPEINAEWFDVVMIYVPELLEDGDPPPPAIITKKLDHDEEEAAGLCCRDEGVVIISGDANRESRAYLQSTLIHEGAHLSIDERAHDLPPRASIQLEVALTHGPLWCSRMMEAARVAQWRGEEELASLLVEDVEFVMTCVALVDAEEELEELTEIVRELEESLAS